MGYARFLLRTAGVLALVGCSYLAGSAMAPSIQRPPAPPLTPLVPPPDLAVELTAEPTPPAVLGRSAGVAIPTVPPRPSPTTLPVLAPAEQAVEQPAAA